MTLEVKSRLSSEALRSSHCPEHVAEQHVERSLPHFTTGVCDLSHNRTA